MSFNSIPMTACAVGVIGVDLRASQIAFDDTGAKPPGWIDSTFMPSGATS